MQVKFLVEDVYLADISKRQLEATLDALRVLSDDWNYHLVGLRLQTALTKNSVGVAPYVMKMNISRGILGLPLHFSTFLAP